MPELPEVESVRRGLASQIIGQTVIEAVCAPHPRLFLPGAAEVAQGLKGRVVRRVGRLGKLIIITLRPTAFVTVHLGMTGQLICALRPPEAGHVHMSLRLTEIMVFFRDPRRFGKISFYLSPDELQPVLDKLGPDALTISDEQFHRRLSRHRISVKTALLNQSVLAGVGNIYADEGLFMAGLSPLRPADSLSSSETGSLNHALKRVMRKSLSMGGSTVRNFTDADGRPGTFQEAHQVYQKTGQPCFRCGTGIKRIVLGGRATHYCPACQK
ncbi:MAG: bifunctional DNA-formamidopyrimidine glycosylase/DNA-(apurinic or apyrimidinic site) lyase [Desulfarculales bacterium]|jgi:formamidopyrimidine-DNA glycosylase|nr:bifunctional DNA-formamidopyrimidine glycosylase/DNA-(apurinic or apyrimidinic site) lyase [Desulfarculales bacterium]